MWRFFTFAFLICALPSTVLAQTDEEDGGVQTDEDREAQSLFRAAETAYTAGRYENALDYFERAYALSERPVLLYNIGNCAERLRRDERALEAYSAYLEAIPDASNREAVEARIAILRDQGGSSGGDVSGTSDAPVDSVDDGRPDALGVALLIGAGVMLGVTVGGIVWWADRSSVVDMCNLPDRTCDNAGTLEGEQTAALVTWIAAATLTAAATVAGIVVLTGGDDGESEDVAWRCAVGFGGVSCGGRF